jgi:hypothetical protein
MAGASQGGGGAPDGLEQAISACTRTCSSGNALLALAESYQCEPGDRSQYGVLLHDGEDAEVPTLITDPICVPYCEGLGVSGYECWQEAVAINNCFADAIWVCDIEGGWVSNDCTTVTRTDYCNE